MARIDDYRAARELAQEKLATEAIEHIVQRAGLETLAANIFKIPFLDRSYHINYPDFQFEAAGDPGGEVPIQEQVLILHYLLGAGIAQLAGKWIAYREIPGAAFYFSAFVKRAINPLKDVFGQNLTAFRLAAQKLKGAAVDYGDAGFEFRIFKHLPLRLIVWEGDSEFPAEANILFDQSIGKILAPEDVAWLAAMIVYRLIKLSHE